MKLLIVDDSKMMRAMIKRTLRQAGITGHEILESDRAADAFEKIRTSKPDLVLCDWNMPEMTGIELLQKLNKHKIRPRIGFITTEITTEYTSQAKEEGALFVIGKPFSQEDFIQTIKPLLRS